MEPQPEEAVAAAVLRAIQALEKMLATLHRTARAAARLRQIAVAHRLDELAADVEQSLYGLRSHAAGRRSRSSTSRRNGR